MKVCSYAEKGKGVEEESKARRRKGNRRRKGKSEDGIKFKRGGGGKKLGYIADTNEKEICVMRWPVEC